MARWLFAGNNAEMPAASGGLPMSILRRGRGRCVRLFSVLLVPWQFFRLADAVRCIGHRSALHRLLQRAALGFAARCVRHTSPHAIVTGALPMGNLPLSCILFIRSFCSFLPYLPFPHPLPTSSSGSPDKPGGEIPQTKRKVIHLHHEHTRTFSIGAVDSAIRDTFKL